MSTRPRQPLSLILAYTACLSCLAGVIPAAFFLPSLVRLYVENYLHAAEGSALFVTVVLYVGMAIATAVLVLLLCLLGVCRRGAIFTPVSGRLVLAIAVLVIAEGAAFALLSTAVLPVFSLAVTVVALTMGLCFFVVSHVLREAARIKEENDATI